MYVVSVIKIYNLCFLYMQKLRSNILFITRIFDLEFIDKNKRRINLVSFWLLLSTFYVICVGKILFFDANYSY